MPLSELSDLAAILRSPSNVSWRILGDHLAATRKSHDALGDAAWNAAWPELRTWSRRIRVAGPRYRDKVSGAGWWTAGTRVRPRFPVDVVSTLTAGPGDLARAPPRAALRGTPLCWAPLHLEDLDEAGPMLSGWPHVQGIDLRDTRAGFAATPGRTWAFLTAVRTATLRHLDLGNSAVDRRVIDAVNAHGATLHSLGIGPACDGTPIEEVLPQPGVPLQVLCLRGDALSNDSLPGALRAGLLRRLDTLVVEAGAPSMSSLRIREGSLRTWSLRRMTWRGSVVREDDARWLREHRPPMLELLDLTGCHLDDDAAWALLDPDGPPQAACVILRGTRVTRRLLHHLEGGLADSVHTLDLSHTSIRVEADEWARVCAIHGGTVQRGLWHRES